MEYSLDRYPQFVEDNQEYFSYLKEFDEAVAVKHYQRFESALIEILIGNPYRYSYFKETGAPYHSKLFRVGKKTFWIVYTIEANVISLRRFWDCARQPGTHGLR
jgi:hypothetical protein